MKKPIISAIAAAVVISLAGCSEKPNITVADATTANQVVASTAESVAATNILMQPFTGPYEGVPAFDKMNLDLLIPAVTAGMELQLAEIDAIANDPAAPNFENTFAAMERAGKALDNVFTYWGIWASNMSSPEFRAIQRELSPKLSEFSSKISQNKALFERVKAVYESDEYKTMTLEQQRIVKSSYEGFVRSGILLDEAGQKRTAEINKELAKLHTQFANNVLNDEESYVTYITKDQLSGLPDSFVKASAAAAEQRGQAGKYAITNTRSSMDPFLTYSDNRELREKVWNTYYSRGDNGDEFDN
ncbi:MAG: M3 family peptidase, partial [Glaciecola sp.]